MLRFDHNQNYYQVVDEEGAFIGTIKKTVHHSRMYCFFPESNVFLTKELTQIVDKLKELNNEK